jgi:lipoprotein-anchoring transpeptidase ErfK/SrfK
MILRLLCLAMLAATWTHAQDRPAAHTQGIPTGKPTGSLKPGEYWWNPQIAPAGPVIALVSIQQQVMHVYRNGILIGRTTVSTGSRGHGTPSGVFSILEKKQKHYSKKYNNAPMPNMQRLTWTGIAMHSGNLPGYPASHGCIRMPWDFSKLLFGITAKGGTVVISDGKTSQPHLAANPGVILAPKDFSADMLRVLEKNGYDWRPERSPTGPVSILISGADRTMYVYRNGNPIGRAALEITGDGPIGGHVLSLLDGVSERRSWWAPGRQARKWMRVTSDDIGRKIDIDDLSQRLHFSPEFATVLYDIITPGTTVIVTDQPAVRKAAKDFTILTN